MNVFGPELDSEQEGPPLGSSPRDCMMLQWDPIPAPTNENGINDYTTDNGKTGNYTAEVEKEGLSHNRPLYDEPYGVDEPGSTSNTRNEAYPKGYCGQKAHEMLFGITEWPETRPVPTVLNSWMPTSFGLRSNDLDQTVSSIGGHSGGKTPFPSDERLLELYKVNRYLELLPLSIRSAGQSDGEYPDDWSDIVTPVGKINRFLQLVPYDNGPALSPSGSRSNGRGGQRNNAHLAELSPYGPRPVSPPPPGPITTSTLPISTYGTPHYNGEDDMVTELRDPRPGSLQTSPVATSIASATLNRPDGASHVNGEDDTGVRLPMQLKRKLVPESPAPTPQGRTTCGGTLPGPYGIGFREPIKKHGHEDGHATTYDVFEEADRIRAVRKFRSAMFWLQGRRKTLLESDFLTGRERRLLHALRELDEPAPRETDSRTSSERPVTRVWSADMEEKVPRIVIVKDDEPHASNVDAKSRHHGQGDDAGATVSGGETNTTNTAKKGGSRGTANYRRSTTPKVRYGYAHPRFRVPEYQEPPRKKLRWYRRATWYLFIKILGG